ncbi:MAG: MBL fold metallo-hydrolase [Oscillospiraceae bacterium]|nr:MBL fold metallo-hydrolase [Oscillospiraceae bacterium]
MVCVIAVAVVVAGLIIALVSDWDEIYAAFGLKDEPPVLSGGEGVISVHYIDVGQGDCQLIITPNYSVLIDSGENKYAEEVISYIKSLKISKLDYIIVSHPHADHIGGMGKIINEFKPDKLIMPKVKDELIPTTASFVRMLDAIEANSVQAAYANAGDKIELDICYIEILAPIGDFNGINDYSVIVRLVHGGNAFLFTGDVESAGENALLDSKVDIKASVLKVAHHGSRTSSQRKFLEAVGGLYAVISAGADNSYNHPHDDTVERLILLGYEILRTDTMGTIIFESDEAGISIINQMEVAA